MELRQMLFSFAVCSCLLAAIPVVDGFRNEPFVLPSFDSGSILNFTTSFKDPQRNREVAVIIYYPANNAGKQLPLVVFSHCYLGFDTWYGYLVDASVPRGYIWATIDAYNADPDVTPMDLALDQSFLLDAIVENAAKNASFPLYNMVGSTYAAGGHSLGGAASFISGNSNNLRRKAVNNFTTIFTLSGCQPPPGDEIVASLKRDTLPALLFSGTEDCMCGPFGAGYFQDLPSACKYFVNIVNATHCQMADMWHDAIIAEACHETEAAIGCQRGRQQLSMDQQLAMVVRYVEPWLDFTLKGDQSQRNVLNQLVAEDIAAKKIEGTAGCNV
eukprot:TRINITY_DN28994_c0_g1_i1.p1 TRINITY_DN28994_c0_g1~~TRINITY_DN28994_c0_g1_i1.p1  ORF type:complete len:352 (+),score=63.12 TRINITY_DN28994_c0_g1_i1:70-1056(+)